MSSRSFPQVASPSKRELRALWRQFPEGHVVRSLILEIVRQRRVVPEIERLRQSIQTVWSEEVGGNLVALYQMRVLLAEEMRRIGE